MKRILSGLFIIIIIALAGCTDTPLPHRVSSPDIATGNDGESCVLYQVYHNFKYEYYLQKLSPAGSRLWGEKGLFVTSMVTVNASVESQKIFFGDDNIIAVCAKAISSISHEGKVIWSKTWHDIESIGNIVSDGAGGVIYVTDDACLKRIDNDGNVAWNTPISDTAHDTAFFKIDGDGSGGAVIAIIEKQIIKIQMIDSDGNYSWSQEAIQVHSGDREVNADITADGSKGAYLVWMERDPDDTKIHRDTISILRAGEDGEVLWQKNDLPGRLSSNAFIVTGDDGTVFVFWDFAYTLYAQKISPDGNLLWTDAKRFEFDGSVYRGISNGNNGVILGWNVLDEGRFLRGQIMDADGSLMYSGNGGIRVSDDNSVHLSDLIPDTFRILPGGDGGALFAWGSSDNFYSVEHSFVQKLNGEGRPVWGDSGIQLDDWN